MNQLLQVMRTLRSKKGCPWDRKQTMDSLRRCVLEEAHEVMEAISLKNRDKIEEELGDMLVVISMLIAMGEEKKQFSKNSIMSRAVKKMIHRHPHVFGSKKAKTAGKAYRLWNEAKMEEKRNSGMKSVLEDLKSHYPSLLLAYKAQRKVARVGFDWNKLADVIAKVDEELYEIKAEIKRNNKKKIKEEIGDFLFSAVNLARKLDVDPELALKDSVKKFKKRFSYVEREVSRSGKQWNQFTLKELDDFWGKAKKLKK